MPFLENVLVKHYRKNNYKSFEIGESEAYSQYGHIHFYTKDSLQTALHHIGFKVDFVESGISSHPDLHGLNTRNDIVNVHAELTKI